MSDTKNFHDEKKPHPTEKTRLHPKNRHRERYDFRLLTKALPALSDFVTPNRYGDESIDFADPKAVRALNAALLMHYYDITQWQIPDGYLCPPIPGRADYIHHIATLLSQKNFGKIPSGDKVKVLDVGIGANCIYPIIGIKEYAWHFVGSDIDPLAVSSAQNIIDQNEVLKDKIELRLQSNATNIFKNIIKKDEFIDFTICNPPFHATIEDAKSGTNRKLKNLKNIKSPTPVLNFGGQESELIYEGGEEQFVQYMIYESKLFESQVCWFSTLISKQSNLRRAEISLNKTGATEIKIIPMGQGNKTSRILAWTFLKPHQQKEWSTKRF